jgi:hypothetical protein
MARYPFIKNLQITSISGSNNRLTITGILKVLFTREAWREFGYKRGNFYWFNKYWQDQVGKTVQFGNWHLKLLAIKWTLLEHEARYDKLGFVLVLANR